MAEAVLSRKPSTRQLLEKCECKRLQSYSGTHRRVMCGSMSNLRGSEIEIKVKEVSSPDARTAPKRMVWPAAVEAYRGTEATNERGTPVCVSLPRMVKPFSVRRVVYST